MVSREDLENVVWSPEVYEYIGLRGVKHTEVASPLEVALLKVFRAGAVYAWDQLAPEMQEAMQDAAAYKRLSEELVERLSIAQKVIAQKNAQKR